MPPGDPHEAYRDYQMDPAQLPLSRIHLRVDWQTLRRLPLSGAIIFNFKALFTPVEEFSEYVLPFPFSALFLFPPFSSPPFSRHIHTHRINN